MNGFTIYKEYYDLMTLLPEIEQQELLLAITKYMFNDTEPVLNDNQMKIFKNLKRPLDVSKNQSKRRARKEPEENRERTGRKPRKKPEENPRKTHQDVDVNVNVDVNNLEEIGYGEEKPLKNDFTKTETSADLFSLIEESFGRTLNSIEYQTIQSWEDNDLTRYAVKESILNGARGIRYIETVLSSWKAKGFKTVEDVQHYQKKRKEVKLEKDKPQTETPEWMNKQIESEKITEEEQNELNTLLERISTND